MLEGSAVARINVEPARLTGTTVCLSATSSGDQLDHHRVDLELVEVDRRNAVLLRDEVGELVLVQVAQGGDLGTEASALVTGLILRLTQLLGRELARFDQQLADSLVHTRLRPGPCG